MKNLLSRSIHGYLAASFFISSSIISSEFAIEKTSCTNDQSDKTMILDFQANKLTESWHWFPLQAVVPWGESKNNLFAPSGALDKYDLVFLSDSSLRESRSRYQSYGPLNFGGHQLPAAIASCILRAPAYEVVMKNFTGVDIKFDTLNTQGLVIKIVEHLVDHYDIQGELYEAELTPLDFLSVIEEWKSDGLPFFALLKNSRHNWYVPFDRVRVFTTTIPPDGFSASVKSVHSDDKILKYFSIEMSSHGFGKKRFNAFVQYDSHGKPVASGWMPVTSIKEFPCALIRPHPVDNIYDKTKWFRQKNLRTTYNNPAVDPQSVFDIYEKSIKESDEQIKFSDDVDVRERF